MELPYCKRCGRAVELFDVMLNGGVYRHRVDVPAHERSTCPLRSARLYSFNDGKEMNDVEWG